MAGEIEVINKLIRKDQQPGGPVLPVVTADQVEGLLDIIADGRYVLNFGLVDPQADNGGIVEFTIRGGYAISHIYYYCEGSDAQVDIYANLPRNGNGDYENIITFYPNDSTSGDGYLDAGSGASVRNTFFITDTDLRVQVTYWAVQLYIIVEKAF